MSKYGVYIIECLREGDFFDGKHLANVLRVCEIEVIYSCVTTKKDFIEQARKFKRSKLRYLHLSFHGCKDGIEISKELISNFELMNILKGALLNKRIFMSACKSANRDLASKLISKNNAYSLIGTPIDLGFDKSVIFWPAFYHVMAEADAKKMKRQVIVDNLKRCVDLFGVPINFYCRIDNNRTKMKRYRIRYKKGIESRVVSFIV